MPEDLEEEGFFSALWSDIRRDADASRSKNRNVPEDSLSFCFEAPHDPAYN